MLVKLSILDDAFEAEEVEALEFSSLPLRKGNAAREADLEDLIAHNPSLIEASGDEDETLLIVGRQVSTATGKRMDLVALDNTGALILIEVKRDARDVAARKDNAEIQAVRYAASLATLRSIDEIVVMLYGPYIEHNETDEWKAQGGGRSATEWARKKLLDFIEANHIAPERVNHAQKIVLIGGGFDKDTLSAAAWMACNGLPLRVIVVWPHRLDRDFVLDIRQLIPPPASDSFYVDLTSRRVSSRQETQVDGGGRTSRLRLRDLLGAGLIAPGDEVWFKNTPDARVVMTSAGKCRLGSEEMSLLAYGKRVSGWGAVNIYDWMMHGRSGKLLGRLREELEASQAAADEAAAVDNAAGAPLANSDL